MPLPWVNLGNLHAQHGEYDSAVACFKWVLNLNNTNAEACNNLGSVYEGLGRYDDAVEMYRKSIAIKSAQEEAQCNLALLEYKLGKNRPDGADLRTIHDRLQFVLSINAGNARARQLLEEIKGLTDFEV